MSRIVFLNANVLDGQNQARAATVVVEDGRIATVDAGNARSFDEADDAYDLAGRTLMPGMVTGHFHPCYHNLGAEAGMLGSEVPVASAAYRALANAQLALRCGFTGVVGAGVRDDIDPQLEQAIEAGLFDGPRVVPCNRDLLSSADTFMSWWLRLEDDVVPIGIVDGPDEVRKSVRKSAGRGARMIKMSVAGGHGLPGPERRLFTREEIRAGVETAHDLGIRIRTHVTGKTMILECIELGVDILDHCDGLDEECIEAMAKAGCIMLPSLYAPWRLLVDQPAYVFGYKDDLQREFDTVCAMLPKAVAAGVTICVGDDYGVPTAPHGDYAKELAVYVEQANIDALEVIRWATVNGAKLMQRENDLGMIEAGRLADLIVVDGDPIANINVLAEPGAILSVMRDGRFVTNGRPPRADTTTARAAPRLVGATA